MLSLFLIGRRKRGINVFIPFTDLVTLIALTFIVLFSPEEKPAEPNRQALWVAVEWDMCIAEKLPGKSPGKSKVDMDLWPWSLPDSGGSEVVGYRRTKGLYYVLNTDDLGAQSSDPPGAKNEEIVISTVAALPAGEHGINLHVFGLKGSPVPVCVKVTVIVNKDSKAHEEILLKEKEFKFTAQKEEQTLITFWTDAAGNVIEGATSFNRRVPVATVPNPF